MDGEIIAILVLVPIGAIGAVYVVKNYGKKTLQKTVSLAKDVAAGTYIEPHFYEIAEEEINSGNVDKGLWAKALVNAKGKEESRKLEYLKLRAKQLHSEKP